MACQLGGVSSVDSVDTTVYADGDLTAIVLGLSHLLSPLSEQLAECSRETVLSRDAQLVEFVLPPRGREAGLSRHQPSINFNARTTASCPR
jgi:hypothetical protein